jgi:hypothetical protein
MPCLLAAVGALFPRITLVLMWLVGYGGQAFNTVLVPLLGFFFLPFTTCFYAIARNEFGAVQGWGMALLILVVVLDLGSWGQGTQSGRRYRNRQV